MSSNGKPPAEDGGGRDGVATQDLAGMLTDLDLHPAPRPASLMQRVAAQAEFDTRMMLHNGEQLTLTIVLPAMMIVGFRFTTVPYLGPGRRIDVATPGVIALGVLSTAFTGLAIGTGFDRRYGVLRLLGTTPLGRGGLLAGRTMALLLVAVVQLVVFGVVGLALGWEPNLAGLLNAWVFIIVGTIAFASLGMLLAGTMRAEAVLPAANLIWVVFIVVGGAVIPAERLGWIGKIAEWLPSAALGHALRACFASGVLLFQPLLVLAVWAALGVAAAARWFHWD